MPSLTRWFIKTALVYLVISLVLGVLVALGTSLQLPVAFAGLTPFYIQILMIGWLTQLIFGVAYWMFPVFSRETPRRSPVLGWAAYGLINAGLLLQLIVELGSLVDGFPLSTWVTALAAVLQFAAALSFVVNSWGRIRGH
ncbi:MAG TPA: hypothetical protein VE553_02400 [Candidatus Binatia bacterium]|jgi:hypothetical protein|nr:hypothetical protein [Candidatus Binatia bacterium]